MPRASLAKSPHLPDSQTPLTHPLTAALPGPPKFWPPAKVPICHHVYWYSPGWHIASHHRHSLTLQCPLIPHCEITYCQLLFAILVPPIVCHIILCTFHLIIYKDPQELPCYICSVSERDGLILTAYCSQTGSAFITKALFFIHRSLTQSTTQPLITGPASCPGVGCTGILVSGSRDDRHGQGHPQEWARPRQPGSWLCWLCSLTKQRSQKVGSQYHQHKAPKPGKCLLGGSFLLR